MKDRFDNGGSWFTVASPRLRRVLTLLGLTVVLLSVGGGYPPAQPPYPNDCERFGVGLAAPAERIVDYDLQALGAAWYLNWGTAVDPPHPNGVPFMHTIRLAEGEPRLSDEQIVERVEANPGATWQIGNEPDSIFLDNTEPAAYAAAYHHLYHLIKGHDSSALVANGGLVQATPLRMAYLDRVWASYQDQFTETMPVDVWIVHGFILREERGNWGAEIPPGMGDVADLGKRYKLRDHDDLTIFAEQIERFRQWMADHGQREKPLIVNEYGILMWPDITDEDGEDFSADRVIAFMEGTFDTFLSATDPTIGLPADEGRLVQAWAWYSLDDNRYADGEIVDEGYNGDLFTGQDTKTITAIGQAYAAYVDENIGPCEPYTDLGAQRLDADVPGTASASAPVTVTVSAEVVNYGLRPAEDVAVELWNGAPDAGGALIGQYTVPDLPGRYEGVGKVSFSWGSVGPGVYTVTVDVDPEDAVFEVDEANNTAAVRVLVPSTRVFLPLVTKGFDSP